MDENHRPAAFDEIRASGKRPPWGKLPCGHEATVELVKGDKELIAGLCFSLHQWRAVHWLCNLASDVNLDGAKVREAKDDGGKHRTADFFGADRASKNFVVRSARQIVMVDMPIDQYGWPKPWSPATREPSELRPWLQVFAQFLSKAKRRDELDAYMRKSERYKGGWDEWATGSTLWDVNPAQEPLTPEREKSLEEHLYLRYALTSLMCKQVPAEFQELPPGDFHKCRVCREEAKRAEKDLSGKAPGQRWEEQIDLPDQ